MWPRERSTVLPDHDHDHGAGTLPETTHVDHLTGGDRLPAGRSDLEATCTSSSDDNTPSKFPYSVDPSTSIR